MLKGFLGEQTLRDE